MPPLRERKVDIPLLVAAFLAKHADPMRPIEGICQDFWRSVTSFDWPGNVRELENFVARCDLLPGAWARNQARCLSNAFTSAFKELDPIPQFKATAKLASFLELATGRLN